MRLIVKDCRVISGRGHVAYGAADARPEMGPAVAWLPSGETVPVMIRGIESYAIVDAWKRHDIGLLLDVAVPEGSVIEQ